MIARARNTALAAFAAALALAALTAAPASADFGLSSFETSFEEADGSPATQAGSHPYAMNTYFEVNRHEEGGETFVDGGDLRDLLVEQARGFVGDATAVPRCSTAEFAAIVETEPSCPDATAVGVTAAIINSPNPAETLGTAAVYNLTPPPGVPVRLGFVIVETPVVFDVGVKPEPDYNVLGGPVNTPQPLTVFGAALQLWGEPSDPAHDFARGHCAGSALNNTNPGGAIVAGRVNLIEGGPQCAAEGAPRKPFLTLPRTCAPLATAYTATSWATPAETESGQVPAGPFSGCGKLEFIPRITSRASADSATTGTGLDFELSFEDPTDHHGAGLTEPGGIAQSDMKKIEVALPEGMSANPSLAEGLQVCTPADLNNETLQAEPGAGCPNGAKIGTVSVQTPLVSEEALGNVFIAAPDDPATATPGAENPFDSLLAFYIVIRNKNLGLLVKVPAEVKTDPATGQLTTVVDNTPQFPFDRFSFHFREGVRAPLITPPACGTYTTQARMTPWARPGEVITRSATFAITHGVGGSPCPSGGLPAFKPALSAGTLSNAAGRFSPFNVKITRADDEQEITHFSIKLPPGVAGRLAGVAQCSDSAIAAAKAREHVGGGKEELASPSCPESAYVGRTLAGSGVGSALTYAPGKIYLAGPYHGHPVSLVAITAGVVGPFDIGTVVVRLALDVNPETGEVFLDSTGSDPIPHIVQGIPIHLRDIRAYTDRPDFVFNPTSCEPSSTSATVLGSGLDFVSTLDDNPFVSTSRFQAADCAALPFKPKLTVQLKGSTKRAGNPALHAHLSMAGMGALGANEAGLAYSRVALPKSLFLDNAHINTICTRVQFREGAVEGEKCPPGSVIGTAKAVTPILSEPLTGPIYLRSSEHQLPDIAAALHGQEISVVAVGHTDSAPGGGLRNTFDVVPDAPITSVDIDLFGGKKGLIISSRNLCSYKPKAKVEFKGHNGKRADYPKLQIKATGCKKKKHPKRHRLRHTR